MTYIFVSKVKGSSKVRIIGMYKKNTTFSPNLLKLLRLSGKDSGESHCIFFQKILSKKNVECKNSCLGTVNIYNLWVWINLGDKILKKIKQTRNLRQ